MGKSVDHYETVDITCQRLDADWALPFIGFFLWMSLPIFHPSFLHEARVMATGPADACVFLSSLPDLKRVSFLKFISKAPKEWFW